MTWKNNQSNIRKVKGEKETQKTRVKVHRKFYDDLRYSRIELKSTRKRRTIIAKDRQDYLIIFNQRTMKFGSTYAFEMRALVTNGYGRDDDPRRPTKD